MFHAFRFSRWWGEEDQEVSEGMRQAREALARDSDDPETLRAAGYTLTPMSGASMRRQSSCSTARCASAAKGPRQC